MTLALTPAFTTHCFFRCGHIVDVYDPGTPQDAHDQMEQHYRDSHGADLKRLGYDPAHAKMANCTRCGASATSWSGAWTIGGAWIGWCGKTCQSAWLRGDREAPATVTKPEEPSQLELWKSQGDKP